MKKIKPWGGGSQEKLKECLPLRKEKPGHEGEGNVRSTREEKLSQRERGKENPA